MIETSISSQQTDNSFEAGAGACREALEGLEKDPSLLVVFSTFKGYEPEQVLKGVNSENKQGIPVVGGTAGWGILHLEQEKEVTANLFSFEKSDVRINCVADPSEDYQKEGKKFAEKFLKNGKPPQLLILFMAGLGEVAPNPFLKGIREVFGSETSIIGGNTGDDTAMESGGYQFIKDRVLEGGVVGAGLWGDFEADLKVEHGFDPLGLEKEVTASEGNIIQEIDGKPAVGIFEDYFEKEEIMSEGFFGTLEGKGFFYPLGIITADRIIARYIMGVNEEGSLVCGASVPEGSKVKVLHSRVSKVKETAANMGQEIKEKEPECVFFFSCAMRRMIITPDDGEEVRIFRKAVGEEVPLVGFYTYGEFCIPKTEKKALAHHETLAVASLKENE